MNGLRKLNIYEVKGQGIQRDRVYEWRHGALWVWLWLREMSG